MGSRCNSNCIFVVNYNINNKNNDNNTNKIIKVMKDGTAAILGIIIQKWEQYLQQLETKYDGIPAYQMVEYAVQTQIQ